MAKKPDFDSLAECLADAGRRLLVANASNLDEVNTYLHDLGNDLLKASDVLSPDGEDQTTTVWNVVTAREPIQRTRPKRKRK